jgi:branched-chain amino acid transport system permease protein
VTSAVGDRFTVVIKFLAETPTTAVVAAAVIILFPWMGVPNIWINDIPLIAILSLLVGGLNLSFGFAGELALGQVAMFAVGAYLTGYLSLHGYNDLVLTLVASGVTAMCIGLITGLGGVRLGGWSLAMTSFFLVLLVPDLINIFSHETGGLAGLAGIPGPKLFGANLDLKEFYVFAVGLAFVWVAFMRNFVTSRHGIAFHVLRESPVLTASVGLPVIRLKMKAYALGAIPAGMAGCLLAYDIRYLSGTSDSFSFAESIAILAASILGGPRSIYGCIVGAAVIQEATFETTSLGAWTAIVYGVLLIVVGLLLRGGITRLARVALADVRHRLEYGPGSATTVTAAAAPGGETVKTGMVPLHAPRGRELRISGVSKRFGGVAAVENVSVVARPGVVTALIGPNGSGKTTVFNLVSGFYSLDRGTVHLGDEDISGRRPDRIRRAGIGRTFQTPIIPTELTAREVVSAGFIAEHRMGMLRTVFRLPSYRRLTREESAEVERLLRFVGLENDGHRPATTLPLGSRRMLELARALAADPAVLLLDEIASGLDESEISQLVDVITAIRALDVAVMLVEHNFPLVLSVADQIYVLGQGAVIACGPPDAVRDDPVVIEQYLGRSRSSPTASGMPLGGGGADGT